MDLIYETRIDIHNWNMTQDFAHRLGATKIVFSQCAQASAKSLFYQRDDHR